MRPKLLHSHVQTDEWYNHVYDKIIKDRTDWWEQDIQKVAHNPKELQLKEIKELLNKEYKKEFSDEEARDAHMRLFMVGSFAMSMGVKKAYDNNRLTSIIEWKRRDREKDNRTLKAIPFGNITCSKCHSQMIYKWSDLWEEGLKKPLEKVMFFYRCPKECMNKLIFEDGTPWVSKDDNSCAICSGERKTTVTKDSQGKMYIIYQCINCKSRQVEDL